MEIVCFTTYFNRRSEPFARWLESMEIDLAAVLHEPVAPIFLKQDEGFMPGWKSFRQCAGVEQVQQARLMTK